MEILENIKVYIFFLIKNSYLKLRLFTKDYYHDYSLLKTK